MRRAFRVIMAAGGMLFSAPAIAYAQDAPETGEAPLPEGARAGTMDSRTSVSDRSISSRFGESEQVTVTGGNPRARVMFRSFVKELREDFRWSIFKTFQQNQLVTGRDDWEIPIRIQLWGEVSDVYRGDDARMSVELRDDKRFHILLAARLHDEFDEEEFRVEAIRALIVEQMLAPYTSDPFALEIGELLVPEWLVHGFDAMIQHRRTGQRSVFYAGVLKSGLLLSPDDLFDEKEPHNLNPISYAVFRVSASAMVNALLDQVEGDVGMREFLGDLTVASGGGEMPLLKKHFPAFREMDQGLEKWWTLQVATLGQQQRFEFLDRHETEEWLTEILTVRFDGTEAKRVESAKEKKGFFERFKKPKEKAAVEGPYVGTLAQFPEFIGRKGAREKFTEAFNQLQHLKTVGFPLYRPLFDRYELVLRKLSRGEVNGVSAELTELAAMRSTISQTLEKSEDYLNYFEATQSPQRSDVFDDYMRMRKEFERRGEPRRDDRITRFMDALEREFR